VGDTYNTSIGQYGFQVTPLQMVRAVGSIANGGTLLTPHVRLDDKVSKDKKTSINLNQEMLTVVKEGMRQAVTEGTATALSLPGVKVAAKYSTDRTW
jgi:penicillin-binding protein 2